MAGVKGRDRGHYEVRNVTRLGVPLAQLWWVPRGEPAMQVLEVAPLRLPLIAKALNDHLNGAAPAPLEEDEPA
jgi:hypothetical protein